MSNNLDPDQDGHFVGPNLGPNCLQNLLADKIVGGKQIQCLYMYQYGALLSKTEK